MKRSVVILTAWLPVILWTTAIFSFSSLPQESLSDVGIIGADKFGHVLEFFVLGALLIKAFLRSFPSLGLKKIVILSILIASSCAAIDEVRQYFIPTRNADIVDFLSDFIGANIGTIVCARGMNWRI